MTSFNHENKTMYSVNSAPDSDRNGGGGVQLVGYTSTPDKGAPLRNRNGNMNTENGTIEERELMLNASPVKLDPGLDSLGREPELVIDMKPAEMKAPAPLDRYRMVFIIFLIHGIGILMPWNMFITAKSYFDDYKLNTATSAKAWYRTEFMFYLGIVSQVSNAVISFLNTFCQFGGQASTVRIAIALFTMVIIFIFTVILAMIDTAGYPLAFFFMTMASASLLNCCAGVYQNSTFGLVAILPMKYTNAIVLGTNLSGVFTSVIAIISVAGSPDPRTSAVYYFIVAIVVLLVAFDCYFLLPLTKFFQYYRKSVGISDSTESSQEQKMTFRDYWEAFKKSCKMYGQVIKKIWLQLFGVWLTFCVSLILFPAIQSNVKMVKELVVVNGTTQMVPVLFPESFEKFWTPVFCFLSFNLFAFLGNLTSELVKWPGPRHVWIPIVLRAVILIPVYVLCNYQPNGVERLFDVYINNDIVFIIAGIVMAFTSGYYSSLTMMYGPKEVEPEFAGRAGMMMAFFLVLGITSGVNLSLVLQKAITKLQGT